MHRTEGANNVVGMFTDGPPGTALEKNWHNAVQEEIAKVIADAGIALLTAGTDTRDQLAMAISTLITAGSSIPKGNLFGCILSNDAGDTAHDINITAGGASDSANITSFVLTTEITKQIDAAFAAGDDAGGMFTGAVGNATWYHVFLIKKDSDGTIDAGFDTSITAANIPAGYSRYRRIGSVLTDGAANILAFIQIEDMFYWKDPPLDVNAVAMGLNIQTQTLSVPLGVNVMVHFNATASGVTYIYFKTPAVDDEAASYTVAPLCNIYADTGTGGGNVTPIMTNTSSQITSRAAVDKNLYISTIGWQDFRGKN